MEVSRRSLQRKSPEGNTSTILRKSLLTKNDIVKVDVIGFNFQARTVEEVTEFYNLTTKQLKDLENTGEIYLFDGEVTITLP